MITKEWNETHLISEPDYLVIFMFLQELNYSTVQWTPSVFLQVLNNSQCNPKGRILAVVSAGVWADTVSRQ